MKRTVVAALLATISLVPSFATDFSNLLFFSGIGTQMMDGAGKVSDTNRIPLQSQVDLAHQRSATAAPAVVVGWSQGGVRALGYASTYPSDTAAAITIGSPTRGYPALLNPQTTLNNVNKDAAKIIRGVAAVVPVLGPLAIDVLLGGQTPSGFLIDALHLSTNSSPNVSAIAQMAMDANGSNYPGLRDLSPNSAFMLNRIFPAQTASYRTVVAITGYYWGVQSTTYVAVNVFGWTWNIPVYHYAWIPTYKTYTVTSYTSTPRLPAGTLVSFIRGTQNDPVTFSANPDQVRAAIRAGSTAMGTAAIIEEALSIAGVIQASAQAATIVGIATGVASMIAAVAFQSSAVDAGNGSAFLANYVTEYGDLLGDRSNDSFIPYSTQSWDLASLGGKALFRLTQDFNDNHQQEPNDPQIWGTGGSLYGGTATSGGYLVKLFQSLPPGVLPASDGTYSSAGHTTAQ